MSAEDRKRARDEAKALKEKRAAERQAKQEERVAAQGRKKVREQVLRDTLSELERPSPPGRR